MSARAGFLEQTRAGIIERVARAMAEAKGRTWSRMTPARRGELKRLARVAVLALKPDEADGDEDVALAVANKVGPCDPVAAIEVVEAWIDEVTA